MRVLLLDTAFAAAPIYNDLVASGHEVWVMGNRATDLLAVKAGRNWIDQDYSRIDDVSRHIERLRIERVVPGCTDVSIDVCARLSLNDSLIDRADVNAVLANKQFFRRLCSDLGLPAPRVTALDKFPVPGRFLCKPIDAFSGRGITLFDGTDMAALNVALDAARSASPSGEALIETHVVGQLYSCSAFLVGQKIAHRFYVREGGSVNPYAVDTSYLVRNLSTDNTAVLERALEKLAGELCLADGLLHAQFILSERGPVIIEVMRRCPGDLYSLLIQYSTGFPYAKAYAATFLGECLPDSRDEECRYVLRHSVASSGESLFEGLAFDRSVMVRDIFPILPMGQMLQPLQRNRAAVLFLELPTEERLLVEYDRFLSRNAYRTSW
jgi:hypothetical protein